MGATQAVELPITAPRALHGVPNAVVIEGASVQFADQLAVDEITLAVQSGTILRAVQLSLHVLLAAVFFSGFVLSVSEFREPVRRFAYALPVTPAIRLIRDIMLCGVVTQFWAYGVLAIISVATLTSSWLILRRGMTRA